MKLGTENSKKTVIAVALFAVALFLLIRIFAGGTGSASAAPSATTTPATAPPLAATHTSRRAARADSRDAKKKEEPVSPSLDPRLKLNLLNGTESMAYEGTGRNIFRTHVDEPIPTPKASALVNTPATPPPPPQPVGPPPINLKFFGFASDKGQRRVFLSQGDNVFVATEGQIVNRRYRVVKINPTSIEIEDVLNNNRQTIPLTQG